MKKKDKWARKYFGVNIPPYQDDPIYKLFKRDADRDICYMWDKSAKEVMGILKDISDAYFEKRYVKWRKKT